MEKERLIRNVHEKGYLNKLFGSIKAGDSIQIPVGKYKLNSLRAKAGMINTEAGYTKFSISEKLVDFFGVIVITNNGEL